MPDSIAETATFCRCLRTKKMYLPTIHLEADPREETLTAHYWCLRTQTSVGPDDRPVRGKECRSGRPCWEPEF